VGKNGALDAYRRKRDLRRSSEPSDGSRGPGWLLVKKDDKFAKPGSDPEQDEPESVQSGKDIGQAAEDK